MTLTPLFFCKSCSHECHCGEDHECVDYECVESDFSENGMGEVIPIYCGCRSCEHD